MHNVTKRDISKLDIYFHHLQNNYNTAANPDSLYNIFLIKILFLVEETDVKQINMQSVHDFERLCENNNI